MLVYVSDNYKVLLKTSLLEKKAQFGEAKYSFQRMAKHCRIEKSYLSRTLNGDTHLSHDQLYLACEFLGFSDEEKRYISLTHQYARTDIERYRKELKAEITKLRKQGKQTAHTKDASAYSDDAHFPQLFLNPHVIMVHEMLSIEKYAGSPEAISRVLHINLDETLKIIGTLENLGFVAKENGRYEIKKKMTYLPNTSPFFKTFHSMTHAKSMERVQRGGFLGSIHLWTFSATAEVFQKVMDELYKAVVKAEKAVEKSPREDLYQMNLQLFPWA